MQAPQKPFAYHRLRADGLYEPVHFVFVNERMRDRILHERAAVLERLAPFQRARQARIFGKYDPDRSHRSFKDILVAYCQPKAA